MKKHARYKPKLPEPRTEHSEFGPAKAGIILCQECGAIYFLKSWHHPTHLPARMAKSLRPRNRAVGFSICPACAMLASKLFEGEVIVANVSPEQEHAVRSAAQSFADRAYSKDCQHRLVHMTYENRVLRLTTTENQLAASLARMIAKTFHGVCAIAYTPKPSDVVRVKVVLQSS